MIEAPMELLPMNSALPVSWPDTALWILAVKPGERQLFPEFGWKAHHLPSLGSEAERAMAALFAEEALARWAPQLRVERVGIIKVEGGAALIEMKRDQETAVIRVRHLGGGPRPPSAGEDTGR